MQAKGAWNGNLSSLENDITFFLRRLFLAASRFWAKRLSVWTNMQLSLNIDEWDQNKKNSVKLTLASSCLFSEVEPAPFLWNIKNMNKKQS